MTVHSVQRYALAVPDLDEAEAFHVAFGLEVTRADGVLMCRAPGRDRDELMLIPGPSKRLHHIAFSATADGVAQASARLRGNGVAVTEQPPEGIPEGGLWFTDLHGVKVNLVIGEPGATRLRTGAPANLGGVSQRTDIAAWKTFDPDPKPFRLGHFLIYTPDIYASETWYSDMLGLRVTDRSVGKGHFLGAGGGTGDHHVFGFVGTSDHNGLHHSSWEMSGPDEMVLAARRMEAAGYAESWGLGRHTIGSNFFWYFRDPWGSWVEYFADMDVITDKWVASDVTAPPHVWAPDVAPDFFPTKFFKNFEPA